MATTTQVRAMLNTLMLAAPGSLVQLDRYADPNEPLSDSDVPGFFVERAGRAEHENTAAFEQFTTRRWLIEVVAAEVEDDTLGAKETAEETAEGLLDDIIYYLRCQSGSISPSMSIKDNGVRGYQRSTKQYVNVSIMLDIGTLRSR